MLGTAVSPGPCWLTDRPNDQCQDPLGYLSSQSALQAMWYPGAFSAGREDHAVDRVFHGPGKGKLEEAKVIHTAALPGTFREKRVQSNGGTCLHK